MTKSRAVKSMPSRAQELRPIGAGVRARIVREEQLQPAAAATVLRALRHGRFLPAKAAREAAFHLTKSCVDIERFYQLISGSRQFSDYDAQRLLVTFIASMSHSIAAAHLILVKEPVYDVFELGAVKGTGKARRLPGMPYSFERKRENVAGVRPRVRGRKS